MRQVYFLSSPRLLYNAGGVETPPFFTQRENWCSCSNIENADASVKLLHRKSDFWGVHQCGRPPPLPMSHKMRNRAAGGQVLQRQDAPAHASSQS